MKIKDRKYKVNRKFWQQFQVLVFYTTSIMTKRKKSVIVAKERKVD